MTRQGLRWDLPFGPSLPLREVLGEIAGRADRCDAEGIFPAQDVALLGRIGLLRAFASPVLGGYEFQSRRDYVDALFDCLRLVGRANLSLGRIFEGHVNAVLLIDRYGDRVSRGRLTAALAAGKTLWSLEYRAAARNDLVSAVGSAMAADRFQKLRDRRRSSRFCRDNGPPVTTGSKQMLVMPVGQQKDRADPGSWKVSGMRATVSGSHDFSGLEPDADLFLGNPGDYGARADVHGGRLAFHRGPARRYRSAGAQAQGSHRSGAGGGRPGPSSPVRARRPPALAPRSNGCGKRRGGPN